jgi:hypothetical protein
MADGENAVARMTNWSQRVNREIQGALDWYKEWGIIFSQENNAAPPSVDELIKQKMEELRKCVGHERLSGRVVLGRVRRFVCLGCTCWLCARWSAQRYPLAQDSLAVVPLPLSWITAGSTRRSRR